MHVHSGMPVPYSIPSEETPRRRRPAEGALKRAGSVSTASLVSRLLLGQVLYEVGFQPGATEASYQSRPNRVSLYHVSAAPWSGSGKGSRFLPNRRRTVSDSIACARNARSR